MLKNYWYAVEFGHAVRDTPVQVGVFGQRLVLYRNHRGEIVCHSAVCPHRGGSLAAGKVLGDSIACPYHGWQFGADGACVKIPANPPDLPISRKARVDSYPAVERYGYVFVFLGDLPEEERPPLPVLPVLEPRREAHVAGQRIISGDFAWSANYERVLENTVDTAHAPFVHAASFGNPDRPEVEDFELQQTHTGEHLTSAVYRVRLDAPAPRGIWGRIAGRRGERPPIEIELGVYFPNLTFLRVRPPFGTATLITAVVPVDEARCVSKWLQCRDFLVEPWQLRLLRVDQDAYRRVLKVFEQDRPIVEGQRPTVIPLDIGAELHVKSDAIQLAYRRWRLAARERGWWIDDRELDQCSAREGVPVLASPARREHPGGWVRQGL